MEPPTNDNPTGGVRGTLAPVPDSHGQAAMLLVESLLHGLIARSVLSVDDAVEVVDVACEVKEQVGAEWGDTPASLQRSLSLLEAIRLSLNTVPKT